MSACSQCGTVVKPADKFCNVCGSPMARVPTGPAPGAAPAAAPATGGAAPSPYAATAAPPGYEQDRERGAAPYAPTPAAGYSGPSAYAGAGAAQAPARCQAGHEIAPGGSYCALGHPIALNQMQFANDPYAGYGQPPPGQGYGQSPPAQGYGQSPPAQGYGQSPPAQGYGQSPPAQGYGQSPPAQDYGAPPRGQAFPTPAPPPYGGQPGPGGYPPGPPNQAAYAAAFGNPAGYAPQPSPGYAPPAAQPPAASPQYGPAASPQYAPSPAGGPSMGPAMAAAMAPTTAQPQFVSETPGRVLRGFLVAYGTNASGEFWPLTAGRHAVGRFGSGDGLDIPLQDPTISSRHAVVVVDGAAGTVGVEDTGSTNGTFVNDEHIGYGGRRDLRDGDRIRFGGFTTIVKVIGRV